MIINRFCSASLQKSKVQESKVARKITSATMELYWNIGKELSVQHLSKGYGAQVVEMLTSDLQKEFPGTTGFSSVADLMAMGVDHGRIMKTLHSDTLDILYKRAGCTDQQSGR